MSPIEQACLEFCIELLNQHHQSHEYESALVCAMAVQGWGEASWRDPDNYPPILSRVIKVARFMVVQKALWLDPRAMDIIYMWHLQEQKQAHSTAASISWPLASADNHLGDINRDPTDARVPVERKESFHDWVKQIVSSFMIRGTHGPIQIVFAKTRNAGQDLQPAPEPNPAGYDSRFENPQITHLNPNLHKI
ncbi:hypothetical protein BDW59DRAFT_167854 [Aspergillus cavernicola]|uniref:Uncharacterized protein n=1 Tax=Aspergillus cavernicola TaxID=176166 RepID=A0ABR4H9U9_9EURO